ncbi:MAG: ABC transporter permease [Nitrososphaerales archaeon]
MLKALAYGCLIFLSLFVVAVVVSTSIFTNPQELGLAFFSDEVIFAIILTLITATTATAIALIIATPAAYALSQANFPGKSIVDTLIDIPIALPPVALGTALLIFFTNTPIGIFINNSLIKFVFEVPGIILAQFSVVSVLAVRLLKPVFESIDPRYVKIARTLGESEARAFLRVTLPLAKGGIFSAAVLSWARAMGEFGATITLAGATRFKTETLSIAMYLSLAVADLEKAMAIILILLALTVSTLLITRRVFTRGLTV